MHFEFEQTDLNSRVEGQRPSDQNALHFTVHVIPDGKAHSLSTRFNPKIEVVDESTKKAGPNRYIPTMKSEKICNSKVYSPTIKKNYTLTPEISKK